MSSATGSDAAATERRGSAQVSALERVVRLLPLPYAVAALVVVLLVPGPLGRLLAHFLDTGDPAQAVAVYLGHLGHVSVGTFVAQNTLNVLVPLYGFLGVRYMRERLQIFRPHCVDLCRGGAHTWDRSFHPVTWAAPVVALLALLFLLRVTNLEANLRSAPGPFSAFQFLAGNVVFDGTIAGFIWVYAASLKGLYDLGREPLNLRSFYDDSMLGLRPLGVLSLRLSYVYFGGVALGALGVLTSPTPTDPRILGLVLGAAILGVGLFFAPLWRIHRFMAAAKEQELSSFRDDLRRLRSLDSRSEEGAAVGDLRDALALTLVRDEIAAIPTWPVDTSILGKLATIVIAVTGIVVAQIVQVQLGIA